MWETVIYIDESQQKILSIEEYITRFGLAGFSNFIPTFMCSMSVIFSFFLILNKHKESFFYIQIFLNLLGNFFYGRVGAITSLVFIFFFIGYFITVKKNIRLFLFCSLSILSMSFIMRYLYTTDELFANWIDWAFRPFKRFIDTGKFGDGSSDILLNRMYFIPKTKTFLFGDGKYTEFGKYYMNTDAGFMRIMLYSGIFAQGFIYLSVLSLLIGCLYAIKNISKSGCMPIFLSMLFQFLFFEFKGEIWHIVVAVLLPIVLFDKEKKLNALLR